jgi:hypothetical protein
VANYHNSCLFSTHQDRLSLSLSGDLSSISLKTVRFLLPLKIDTCRARSRRVHILITNMRSSDNSLSKRMPQYTSDNETIQAGWNPFQSYFSVPHGGTTHPRATARGSVGPSVTVGPCPGSSQNGFSLDIRSPK